MRYDSSVRVKAMLDSSSDRLEDQGLLLIAHQQPLQRVRAQSLVGARIRGCLTAPYPNRVRQRQVAPPHELRQGALRLDVKLVVILRVDRWRRRRWLHSHREESCSADRPDGGLGCL
ncbi:hypothetical protein PF007_g3486 [Phytophthora fragariae]|uniref:Uncharacterized protein n=1 Tax=Phytophthora fragariae TaxID=53985 RepID=A0A6A3TFD9_9STRA|nr:hypothetical protein PF003_g9147 [Phytophthora fragariae]KAE9133069.1 hypothetical protein PF007_g3486 [Phytophthora fragariae]